MYKKSTKYKVTKGESLLFDRLSELYVRMQAATRAANELAIKYGADGYSPEYRMLAGGIFAFTFPDVPPLGFKRVLTNSSNWYVIYFSSKDGNPQQIYDQVAALPLVSYEELHTIIRYDQGIDFLNPPVTVKWSKEYILLQVLESSPYAPVEGMVNISIYEFEMLEAATK